MANKANARPILMAALILAFAFGLGLFSTEQFVRARGIDYLEHAQQITNYEAILAGHAGNPWQYRVFSAFVMNVVLTLASHVNVPHHVAYSLIALRVILDTLILLLSVVYYRKLRLSLPHALIGMAVLAWGMSYSYYNSDLSFNTFFDVFFYLLAGIFILREGFIWIVPITLLAAFNRETSGFIPFMLLFYAIFVLPKDSPRRRDAYLIFAAAAAVYALVFVGLRLAYGPQELLVSHGHYPGLPLLTFNLSQKLTWEQLMATLSIIPILALLGYPKWPASLRVFFWVVVPLWFGIHAAAAVMAETRLFLVPQALVLIPGALFFAEQAAPKVEAPARAAGGET